MDTIALRRAIAVVEEFRKIDPEMTLNKAAVFLWAATEDGEITMGEIARHLGLASGAVSRMVSDLGKVNRFRREGHKLLDAVEDPRDRRSKLVHLMPQGKRVAESVSRIMRENQG